MAAHIESEIRAFLEENRDEDYRSFHSKLVPSVDPRSIVGVRTPALRAFARQLARHPEVQGFLRSLPHDVYEENQLHAFVLGGIGDYDDYAEALDRFLPHIDNWATCDQLPVGTLAKQPERTLASVRRWLADGRPYVVRFGTGVLLRLFLDERFDPEQMRWVAAIGSDEHYVNMMRAWYVAEALVRQPGDALALIEAQGLDAWTHNKAIQKARESRRVPDDLKERLKTLKRRPAAKPSSADEPHPTSRMPAPNSRP